MPWQTVDAWVAGVEALLPSRVTLIAIAARADKPLPMTGVVAKPLPYPVVGLRVHGSRKQYTRMFVSFTYIIKLS